MGRIVVVVVSDEVNAKVNLVVARVDDNNKNKRGKSIIIVELLTPNTNDLADTIIVNYL